VNEECTTTAEENRGSGRHGTEKEHAEPEGELVERQRVPFRPDRDVDRKPFGSEEHHGNEQSDDCRGRPRGMVFTL
jgi:hypothetical protein